MSLEPVNPPDLGPTPGYANGLIGHEGGRVLFVAGQIGLSPGEKGTAEELMASQFGEALRRIARIIQAAGGEPTDVGRMTVFVTDIEVYRRSRRAIGSVWRTHFGNHYPAMALVEVKALLDEGALVEIEATAVI